MKKKATRTEVSAGGVVVTHAKTGWWVLVIKDRRGKWTFPKGKIEKDETLVDAARRETKEEVGIGNLRYRAILVPRLYWYFRDGSIHKTVQYFIFETPTKVTPVVQTEEGISDAKWERFTTAIKMIGYPNV